MKSFLLVTNNWTKQMYGAEYLNLKATASDAVTWMVYNKLRSTH